MATTNTRSKLKARLKQQDIVVAPGIYDMVSVRLADRCFDCLYMTGFGTVASYLGDARCGPRHLHRHGRPRERLLRRAARRRSSATATPATAACSTCAHGARLREGGRGGHPARGPGVPEEVRPHAGPARDPHRGHGEEDQGRGRGARRPGLPDHRAHRCAHVARSRRGVAPRRGVC